MPRGVYNRAKVSDEPTVFEHLPLAHGQLIGRSIDRVILHNGVSIAPLPMMKIEKSLFRKAATIPKPPQRNHADVLVLTAEGVYCRYGTYEKLVPHANIYEIDFAPEEFHVEPLV